ncbi:PI-PLC X domain-containing protein 3-like [Limulus polyphemus]|uniref:PI-PLC X domain-containing protein 3-like n=1 Tax=Limulus polyphemus TaxID=6850 RepID=A0ABM1TME2_LIMPO|nr:PI-PLC X domain-containing protein 3-like [Limulus polyphemus]
MANRGNIEVVVPDAIVEIQQINSLNQSQVIDLKQWMQNLPQRLHNVPLNCISIPGSHDSGAYSVSSLKDYAPDGRFLFNSRVGQLLGSAAKKVMCDWMRTQDLNCKEQLENGIRYFDFRVATKHESSDFFIVHGLYGDSMGTILDSIKEFLDLNSKEIVLLHFQHLYVISNDDHHRLLQQITDVFGSKICPVVRKVEEVTLSWMWSQQYQVLVFYVNDIANYHPFLWTKEFITNPWPKVIKGDELIQFLTEQHKQEKPLRKFVVSQGVLTPSASFIMRHPLSKFRDLAECAHLALQEWLKGKQDLNIVISDFVDMKDCWFPRMVVGLNYSRSNHSEEVNGKGPRLLSTIRAP